MSGTRLALAVAVVLLGCGLKTSPVAPELVEPGPASGLRAEPTPSGVGLSWRRPTRYTGGARMRDIERFEIERAADEGSDWAVVGTLVMEDRYRLRQPRRIEWVDATAVPDRRYRYRVTTITRDGRVSVPSDPTAVRHRIVEPEPEADASPDPS